MTVPQAFGKLLQNPRYYWGVITQFFYVGVQIAVWTWTIKYIMATKISLKLTLLTTIFTQWYYLSLADGSAHI